VTPLATLVAALLLVVPDPADPNAWICGSLDAAPNLFGLMGVAAEVLEREGDPAAAKRVIINAVYSGCPDHAPLLTNLTLVVGG
jgi:hypothetical protein